MLARARTLTYMCYQCVRVCVSVYLHATALLHTLTQGSYPSSRLFPTRRRRTVDVAHPHPVARRTSRCRRHRHQHRVHLLTHATNAVAAAARLRDIIGSRAKRLEGLADPPPTFPPSVVTRLRYVRMYDSNKNSNNNNSSDTSRANHNASLGRTIAFPQAPAAGSQRRTVHRRLGHDKFSGFRLPRDP